MYREPQSDTCPHPDLLPPGKGSDEAATGELRTFRREVLNFQAYLDVIISISGTSIRAVLRSLEQRTC
jgi:hypothetical protein